MNAEHDNDTLDGLIADYLNGHLAPRDIERVEAAMASDPAFRARVELDKQVRAQLQRSAQTNADHVGDFAAVLAEREQRRPSYRPVGLATAAAVMVAVVAVIMMPANTPPAFETLGDEPAVAVPDTLRVVIHADSDVASLIERHQLTLIRQLPDLSAIEVRIDPEHDVVALQRTLSKDPAVRFVASP
ncbi:MAG: hypothetical protein AAGA84_08360 [Pseudomonadota bacterium]